MLEEGVPCPALEELWAEYTKPILLEDEVLGTLTLDRETEHVRGEPASGWEAKSASRWTWRYGKESVLDPRHVNVMKKLGGRPGDLGQGPAGDGGPEAHGCEANEWLADNDQTDRDPEERTPSPRRSSPGASSSPSFLFPPGGRFTAWFEDDDLFWGHVITVDGTLKKGAVDADIQG